MDEMHEELKQPVVSFVPESVSSDESEEPNHHNAKRLLGGTNLPSDGVKEGQRSLNEVVYHLLNAQLGLAWLGLALLSWARLGLAQPSNCDVLSLLLPSQNCSKKEGSRDNWNFYQQHNYVNKLKNCISFFKVNGLNPGVSVICLAWSSNCCWF